MMEYRQALGLAIQQVRKERRLTIAELHYRVRISHQAIREIERGVVSPRVDTVVTICQALGIPPSELFRLAEG